MKIENNIPSGICLRKAKVSCFLHKTSPQKKKSPAKFHICKSHLSSDIAYQLVTALKNLQAFNKSVYRAESISVKNLPGTILVQITGISILLKIKPVYN